jgi:hypothetical protein
VIVVQALRFISSYAEPFVVFEKDFGFPQCLFRQRFIEGERTKAGWR